MLNKQKIFNNFWLQPGDTVEHIKEVGVKGTIVNIDFDCYPFFEYGITTCEVQWKDNPEGQLDVQWTNKLVKVEA